MPDEPAIWNATPLILGFGVTAQPGIKTAAEESCPRCECDCFEITPPRITEELHNLTSCTVEDLQEEIAPYLILGRCYSDETNYTEIPIKSMSVVSVITSCCKGDPELEGTEDDPFELCKEIYANTEIDCEIMRSYRESYGANPPPGSGTLGSLLERYYETGPCFWKYLATAPNGGICTTVWSGTPWLLPIQVYDSYSEFTEWLFGANHQFVDCRPDEENSNGDRPEWLCDNIVVTASGTPFCYRRKFLIITDECNQATCIEIFDYDPESECCVCGTLLTIEQEYKYDSDVYCGYSSRNIPGELIRLKVYVHHVGDAGCACDKIEWLIEDSDVSEGEAANCFGGAWVDWAELTAPSCGYYYDDDTNLYQQDIWKSKAGWTLNFRVTLTNECVKTFTFVTIGSVA